MKFIDLFKGKERRGPRAARKQIAGQCPYPKRCYPMKYSIGKNSAGACAGLISDADDLDCIRLCIFYKNESELELIEHFMTPTEATSVASVLITAAENAMEFNSGYKEHYEYLCDVRSGKEVHLGNGLKVLEARIRANGKIFSRHYENVRPEQARRKAQRLGKVIGIKKVQLWEVLGSIETKRSLQDVMFGQAEPPTGDVLLGGISLEEILFPKKKRAERRNKERERREKAEGLTGE